MSENIRPARVVIDGLVIVGSILLAFAIDAWWDWRRERNLERDALERLEADFLAMDSVLVDWRASHAVGLEACDVLLANMRPAGNTEISEDSLANLIGTLRTAWTIDPPFATLSALQSSGQIAVIRNQGLLSQLATFRALMDDLQGDEVDIQAVKREIYLPYVLATVPLRATPYRGPVVSADAGRSEFPGAFRPVLQSREFENIIVDLQRRTANTVANYDAARQGLASIVVALRDELGG